METCMTSFKTLLAAAALIAVPSAALAQVPSGLTDKVKDKAVDTVIENATTDDALTAGKVILKGGSKEDAAVAIVKNRAEQKLDGVVGDKLDGVTGGDVPSSAKVYSDPKGAAVDAAKGSATTYAKDKVEGSSAYTIPKSGTVQKSGSHGSSTTYPSQGTPTAPAAPSSTISAPVNCPAGTTAQPNGTCMVTGNWGG